MGCGASTKTELANTPVKLSSPDRGGPLSTSKVNPVIDPSLAVGSSLGVAAAAATDNNEPLVWIKVAEPLPCSRCGKNSGALFLSQKDRLYLCEGCCSSQQRERSVPGCPQGHTLLREQVESPKFCSVCGGKDKVFFVCRDCDYRICTTKCRQAPTVQGALHCPSGHSLRWVRNSDGYACSVCEKKGCAGGYLCQEDGYFVCVPGCRKLRSVQSCPNGHMLEWHKITHSKKCDACGRRDDQVYECRECDFAVCHLCKESKKRAVPKESSAGRLAELRVPAKPKNGGSEQRHAKAQSSVVKKRYENASKGLRESRRKEPGNRYGGSQKSEMISSRKQLLEMSNLVEGLLEKNANIQHSLATVISRSKSTDKGMKLERINRGKRVADYRSKGSSGTQSPEDNSANY